MSWEAAPEPDGDDLAPLVRPYALTGGRTRAVAGHDLPLETLIIATSGEPVGSSGHGPEHRRILTLCRLPLSVAEVAAHVRVPLGVARVLVGDLAAARLVDVHRPGGLGADGRPGQALLERVLGGLQAL